MHKIIFVILLTLPVLTLASYCQAGLFGVARISTPVLNSPNIRSIFGGKDGSSMKTDRCGQIRELEYIALPGTVFKILRNLKPGRAAIYQVETEEYPVPAGIRLYVDSRFIELQSNAPPPRKRFLPPREHVLATLLKSVGSPYVWGGNVQGGVPELMQYFYRKSSSLGREGLTLKGVDCSGLLYDATAGWTPRNTSKLISFGKPVAVKGKNAEEIVRLLEPLDLIAWNGHLLIVLDKLTTIESRLECGKPGNGGVVTAQLLQRLQVIMRRRKPVDEWPDDGKQQNVFVVRRWYNK
ncbi:MAG: peptidoglycan endopeptidase [Desulfuromonadaceae bacterium]|nr:peptidoglycan endopeptidase [Desulfuromonadaceae bacterium]